MKIAVTLSLVIGMSFFMLLNTNEPLADERLTGTHIAGESAEIQRGALLYDNWMKLKSTRPKATHPLYPSTAKKKGPGTWRCKECHGWDYIGARGRYREGSHYTGIKGVYDSRSRSRQELTDLLRNTDKGHDFSAYLSAADLRGLVAFIQNGLYDIGRVLDDQGHVKGSTTAGKVLYARQCAACHGSNGDTMDFKAKKAGVQGVGWLANDNPQESIHKIRWGHPGSEMPSMIADAGLNEQETVDILAYSRTLGTR